MSKAEFHRDLTVALSSQFLGDGGTGRNRVLRSEEARLRAGLRPPPKLPDPNILYYDPRQHPIDNYYWDTATDFRTSDRSGHPLSRPSRPSAQAPSDTSSTGFHLTFRKRVARIVLVAPALPFALKTPDNPEDMDRSLQEQIFAAWYRDYPKWISDNTPLFFTPETSDAQMRWGSSLAMQASLKAVVACYHAVTQTDFRREVATITLPTLIVQGDKDASCQIDFTGRRTSQLIKGSQFKVYPGAPHGFMITHAKQFNNDLAQFAAS